MWRWPAVDVVGWGWGWGLVPKADNEGGSLWRLTVEVIEAGGCAVHLAMVVVW